MGTISVSLPSDGETIDAADYNTPINTIVSEINGSLDSDNIATGGVVPNSLTTGTGTSWAWQSFTPTWTGITVGDAVQDSTYVQIGKTVHVKVKITMGASTSYSSNFFCTLPVAPSSHYNSSGRNEAIGQYTAYDSSTGLSYIGWNIIVSSSGMKLQGISASTAGTAQVTSGVTNTAPFTWASGDIYVLTGTYEAA